MSNRITLRHLVQDAFGRPSIAFTPDAICGCQSHQRFWRSMSGHFVCDELTPEDAVRTAAILTEAADPQKQDVTVTIVRFSMEPVDDDAGELKLVLYFAGHQRGLVLNKTNALAITDRYGTAWLNQPVTLFPMQRQYGAKMADGIRIRTMPPQPAGQQPSLAPPAASSPPPMTTASQTFKQPQQPTPSQQPADRSPVQF